MRKLSKELVIAYLPYRFYYINLKKVKINDNSQDIPFQKSKF